MIFYKCLIKKKKKNFQENNKQRRIMVMTESKNELFKKEELFENVIR